MSSRRVFALIVVFCAVSQLGCCAMRQSGCGMGCCGMGGQAYDCFPSCGVADSCCDTASCGCPEASCCCPEASCCCPEASCSCPNSCGSGVCCGSPVIGRCRLLARLRNAICGCSGCSGPAYCSEWSDSPPCNCDSCDCYGNYTGGPYASPHGRRAQMAKRNVNISDELRFSEESGTTYR